MVRSKVVEDDEVLKQRQALTRNMSPAELGQIHGLSDLPIPTLRKKKDKDEGKLEQSENSKSKENLYDKLPESLKSECLVRAKIEEDEEVLKQRQTLTRTMSPAQLSEIHGLSDFPMPTLRKKKDKGDSAKLENGSTTSKSRENLYEKLPDSLKAECLVRSKVVEDDKVLKERQELTRTMSPSELGQIHGLSDFPVPTLRKKRDKEEKPKNGEDVTKSKENLYEKLPGSLKAECLVRTKVEEDEKVLKERQELTRTMSPAELSEIRGLSDFPLPSFGKKKEKEKDEETSKSRENLLKLPDSLKAECLVRTKVEEDEEVLKQRQTLTKTMTPAELSQIHGLSDFPMPSFGKKHKEKDGGDQMSVSSKSKENLYEKLPSSLKAECLVRSKVVEDDDVLKQRQALTRAMSPTELGEIRGLSDFPIPSFSKKKRAEKK